VREASVAANPDAATRTRACERRKHRRAALKLAARIRPARSANGCAEEVLWTINSSRSGLYCITASKQYYTGMRLCIAFPYHSAHDDLSVSEETGELVRAELLPGGRMGLGILLRRTVHTETAVSTRSHVFGRALIERRLAVRRPFVAAADVITVDRRMRLQARSEELSANGCYIHTLNPYALGVCVRLRLIRAEKIFETAADIRSSDLGMGMGLAFLDPAPEQQSLLAVWLGHEPTSYYAAT
jgi:hypothetical protein